MNNNNYTETDCNFWMVINPPNNSIKIPVRTMDEVMIAMKTLAEIGNHPSIEESMIANCSGLEEYDSEIVEDSSDDPYSEWYDFDGNDVEFYWDLFVESDYKLRFEKTLKELQGASYNASTKENS